MITEQYINELRKIFDEMGVQLAYLFGSSARGAKTPLSDIDIALLLKEPLTRAEAFDKTISFTHKLIGLFHTNEIDVVILNIANPHIKFNVIRDGQIIYNRDEKCRVNFEVKTMGEYFDTVLLRKEYRKSLFENIEKGKFYD